MTALAVRCTAGPLLQALLAAAQAAGDEGPLRNAFLQLDGMLRLEAVQLGGAA